MTDTPLDGPLFSVRSVLSPFLSPTNMPQSGEQTSDRPQPAPSIQSRLAPLQETAGRVFRKFHQHSISDLSNVGSNDSSPTTTISTVDDSSATEPSPGSSPESPPPNTFEVSMHRPRTADDSRPFFELQKQPPVRKGRNLKNLAVNTSRTPARGASTASLPLPLENANNISSEVSSAFVKPYTPSKKKPNNLGLTLLTPSKDKPALQEIRLAIPPTPAFARPAALRHFQSSPTLPLFSGSEREEGGSYSTRGSTALETIVSAIPSEPDIFEEGDAKNYELPLSQEEKPHAYPDGPICVFEPYIDLYLEPSLDQAREYDVILNVASEVRNPFAEPDPPTTDEPEIRMDGGGGIQYAPKRERIAQKRLETQEICETSPTTPKATPLEANFTPDDITPRARKPPEYIHVKWEHNSDIVPDLLYLVKLIDEKVMQSQRVLIHCQCGVSRSASLVVAYGLYKDRSVSVQQAYDEVKSRSKWIGPNMNLIMQLQEFRTSLQHGGLLPSNRGLTPITPASGLTEWRGPFASRSMAPSSLQTIGMPATIKTQTAEVLSVVISGPSSAPNDSTRPPTDLSTGQRARAVSTGKPGAAYVNPSGHLVPAVPVLRVVGVDSQDSPSTTMGPPQFERNRQDSGSNSAIPTTQRKSSATEEEFAMTPLQPSPDVDPADSFGLMSPTSTEFSSSPFDRAALLARLGMGSVSQQKDRTPRRSVSQRTQKTSPPEHHPRKTSEPGPKPGLRVKISSPDLREQRQLQELQARVEESQRGSSSGFVGDDDGPMSPRATEFTHTPFALSLPTPATPAANSEAAQSSETDPRSPAQKGVSPITRSILDVL